MSDLLVSDTLKRAFNIAVEFIKDNPSTSLSIMFTNYSGDLVAQQWNEGTSALRSKLDQVADISLNGDEMYRLFYFLALDTIAKKRELKRHAFEIIRGDCKIKHNDCKTVLGYKISSQQEYENTFPRYSYGEGFAFPPIKISPTPHTYHAINV
jgi:hypothetical protein